VLTQKIQVKLSIEIFYVTALSDELVAPEQGLHKILHWRAENVNFLMCM
jgi:hypothetical protein